MWYFSWILGTAFAASFTILNALWYEINNEDAPKTCANECSKPHAK